MFWLWVDPMTVISEMHHAKYVDIFVFIVSAITLLHIKLKFLVNKEVTFQWDRRELGFKPGPGIRHQSSQPIVH